MDRRRGTALATVAAAAAGLALLAGCGSGNSPAGGAGMPASADGPAEGSAQRAPGPQPPAGTGLQPGAPGASGQDSKQSGGGSAQAAPVLRTRALIRTAELTVAVDDVAAQAQRVITIALDAGGDIYADQRDSEGRPNQHTADIVVKVPPDALERVLAAVAKLGTEQARGSTTQDVTGQVADVDSRVASARASLARVRALYLRANSIEEVSALEGQLSQREADLESLQAQQRALTAQTATATVTVRLRGREAPSVVSTAPSREGPSGFMSALKAGWHAFAVSIGWLLTALGAALPFLVLIGVLAYAGWRANRRFRPRRPMAPMGPAAPPPAPGTL
jgi:acetolactate synthase regulatory subunit